jgi:hypothetical protein
MNNKHLARPQNNPRGLHLLFLRQSSCPRLVSDSTTTSESSLFVTICAFIAPLTVDSK